MQRRHARLLGVFLLIVLLLAGCGAPSAPPPGNGDPTPDPDPGPGETVVFDTTKVADADTRAALSAYDFDTGELRFERTTDLLDELAPGDVLASEPSPAAPDGYLRLIEEVRSEGDEVVLETSQARLIDAVQHGDLDEEFELTGDDVEVMTTYLPGVRALAFGSEDDVEGRAGIGAGFSFGVEFDEVILGSAQGATAEVRASGAVSFDAGAQVEARIRWCLRLPPACVTRFQASVGFEQLVAISLEGEASATLSRDIRVASFYFKTFTFFLGPVPVVVRPQVEVWIGASGEVDLRFAYAVSQSANALAGARWTRDDGWENITGFGFDLDTHSEFVLEATMNAEAYVRAEASLLLYGIVGPFIAVVLAGEFDAGVPRDPPWILRGAIIGLFGFKVDVPVIGRLADYETELFRFSKELARAQPEPPTVSITDPPDGSSFPVGTEILFEAVAESYASVPLPLTWSIGGETIVTQPNVVGGHSLFYDGLPPGTHTVVATVTDENHDLEAQDQVSVEITYDPPEVYIVHPVADSPDPHWANEPLLLSGQGQVGPIVVAEEQHEWLVTRGTTTVFTGEGTMTTMPGALLIPGSYSVTLSVDDGISTVSDSVSFTVAHKPDDYPTATIINPEADEIYADGAVISFLGEGTDPEDGTLPATSMRWTAFAPGVDPIVLCEGSDFLAPGAPTKECQRFSAPLEGFQLPPGTPYTIRLEVRDSDHNVDWDQIQIRVVVPPAG